MGGGGKEKGNHGLLSSSAEFLLDVESLIAMCMFGC